MSGKMSTDSLWMLSRHHVFILAVSLTVISSVSSTHCSRHTSHVINVTIESQVLSMSHDGEERYEADVTCEWLLRAPSADHAIRVSIEKLGTECSWDRLYIYDGKSFRDKLIGVFSGNLLPRPIYASSGFMLIYFFSDYSGTSTGFQLNYSLVNSANIPVTGDVGRCRSSSDCNNRFGINSCDHSNQETGRCLCEGEFKGVFCDVSGRVTSPRYDMWSLMSIDTEAMSRTSHKVAMISDTAFLFGGYDFSTTSNQLYMSSSDMFTFDLLTPAPGVIPEGRHSHQMVSQRANQKLYTDIGVAGATGTVFGDDSLYIHGGVLSNGSLTSQLWKYSVDTNTWSKLADSPLAVADHVMVTIDNRWLFTHGGRSDGREDNPVDEMYVFDTKEGRWRKESYLAGYAPSLRLAGHTAIVSEYIIYIYGGYTQKNSRFLNIQDTLWKYNVLERIWSSVKSRGGDVVPLAFHAATLYMDKMVVYGGKTNSSIQCVSTDLYIFDITCQTWKNSAGPGNATLIHRHVGQYGHDMLVHDDFLYVYGGVQGSLTYDIIAIGVADVIGQVPVSCDPCGGQSTCESCSLLPSCKWCTAEAVCTSGTTTCMTVYRGDNSGITNMTQCIIEDKPAGWYYTVYKYPVNESQPDEAHLATNSKIDWFLLSLDYVCFDCHSYMLARGHLFERPGSPPLQFRFTATRNSATLYQVIGNVTEKEITSITSTVSQVDRLVSSSDVALGYGTGYMQYKAYQLPLEHLHSHATLGLVARNSVYGYSLPYLSPYSSGLCSSYHNCYLCTTDPACGWCDSQSQCTTRSQACLASGDWMKYSPRYCESCEQFTSCTSCTKSVASCEWSPDIHKCVRKGRRPSSITSAGACPKACSQRVNCTECISDVEDECIWCTTLSKCLPMDVYQLDYQYGECLHYQSSLPPATSSHSHSVPSSRDTCVDCSIYETCDSCSEGGLFCGWCSHNADPIIGVCVAGDFSGPQSDLSCSAIINNTHTVDGDATWSFRDCPDLLECLLGRHDCVEHAVCVETMAAYECDCERGYKGVGNVSCERTCYEQCKPHGTCRKYNETEFGCECDIGWTGEACDVDCQCNQHATCTQGVGICDQCQHFTTGRFCDQCVVNSYGDPSSKDGCQRCSCNGNADPKQECNSSTGVCNCLYNTRGDNCEQCESGYFGNPRDNEECFQCYQGRTLMSNFEGSANYVSRMCHRDTSLATAPPVLFSWQFNLGVSPSIKAETEARHQADIVFELVSVDKTSYNPVLVYDTAPDSVMNETGALAKLTSRDVGVVISLPNGHLTVVYYSESPMIESTLKFKVSKRNCTDGCPTQTSLCSSNKCVCKEGYVGAKCQTKLNCVSQSEATDSQACGSVIPLIPIRHQAAFASSDQVMVLYGGITPAGQLLSDTYIIDKGSATLRSLQSLGGMPSARYGHAMTCAHDSCYMQGGIVSTYPLSLSSEFWKLTLISPVQSWMELDSQKLPVLSGHTLTVTPLPNYSLILIGGLTDELMWNTRVLVYDSNSWREMSQTGPAPPGVVKHSSTYDPSTRLVYVLPGWYDNRLGVSLTWMYVLDIVTGVWNRLAYDNLVASKFHYAFSPLAGYLAVIGGYGLVSEPRVQYDTKDRLSLYSFKCDRWVVIDTPLTDSTFGSVTRETILGYSYNPLNNSLLVVSTDQTTTIVSSTSLSHLEDWCDQQSIANGSVVTKLDCDVDCSSLTTCALCMSTPPYCWQTEGRGCMWDNLRLRCKDRSSPIDQSDFICQPEPLCFDLASSDCLTCTQEKGCMWTNRVTSEKKGHGFCVTRQYASSYELPSNLLATPGECMAASRLLPCDDCLQYNTPSLPTIHVWNIEREVCLSADVLSIVDSGHIGNVMLNHESCPRNCSAYDQCSHCLAQPHCGWCSVAGSQSGDGLCTEGSRTNSSLCTSLTLSDTLRRHVEPKMVQWNYLSCPAENECFNRHHTCDIRVQHCVDQQQGYKCICKSGYRAVTEVQSTNYQGVCPEYHKLEHNDLHSEPDSLCIPICSGGCGDHGCCINIDSCRCDVGFVGENCELECECNRHSYCPVNDLSLCLQCRNFTTGNSCEFCLHGYVGNPRQGIACVSCYDACNGRSNTCTGTLPALNAGPLLDESLKCLDCSSHSIGDRCESCKPGYFLSADNTCIQCQCNGHGLDNTCNPDTGAGCTCRNNTKSVDFSKPSQCNVCNAGYLGDPMDNHQCYRLVHSNSPYCFDRDSGRQCNPLPRGHTAFYSMVILDSYSYTVQAHPTDVRLRFIIKSGVADIYMSNSPSAFTVTFDPGVGEHVVSINQSYVMSVEGGDTWSDRAKRNIQSTSTTTSTSTEILDIKEWDCTDKYEIYVLYDAPMIVKLSSVQYRVVAKFPKELADPRLSELYVVVKSRADGTAGSIQLDRQAPRSNMANIFVLFNIVLCTLLLLGCCAVVTWKMRQLQRIRQLQVIRGVELNAMAERPFSSKIIYMDSYSGEGASNYYPQFNIVPLALEMVYGTTTVVATTFMLLPGDETTEVKATMATALLTWRLSLPPPAKNRADNGMEPDTQETSL